MSHVMTKALLCVVVVLLARAQLAAGQSLPQQQVDLLQSLFDALDGPSWQLEGLSCKDSSAPMSASSASITGAAWGFGPGAAGGGGLQLCGRDLRRAAVQ